MYNPKPIETKDIALSEEMMSLSEMLASNAHDVWAKARIEEGWTYGEIKDSGKKTTPCLIPYNDLPESEKEYDRNTVLETLKVIQKLGYVIVRS